MIFNKFLATTCLATALITTGCGGDEEIGHTTVIPVIPADATLIDSNNALTVGAAAVSSTSTDFLDSATAVQTSLPPAQKTISMVSKYIREANKTVNNTVTAATSSFACIVSGSISITPLSNNSGAILAFNNCNDDGVTSLNGSFLFSGTSNQTTGSYTSSGNGSLTVSSNAQSFTMAFDFSETGNDSDGSFSTNMSFSISGSSVNFLAETSSNLTGIYNNFTGITTFDGGQLLVSGAQGTQLQITINVDGSADVELNTGNGIFTYINTI